MKIIKVSLEEEALRQLKAFIKPRIEAAERGEFSPRSVKKIIEDVRQDMKCHNDNENISIVI